jgi:glucosamine--fructose-6-phosphate aminotransferase (isomerizing)
MCGIVGYKGSKNCLPILIEGLNKLEYRGYDSAGISIIDKNEIKTYKSVGCVAGLVNNCIDKGLFSNIGIGHTRWATHGPPSIKNSHPHTTIDGRCSIVHNGIIENYLTIKQELKEKGYYFLSDTDSEVLLYLIYDYLMVENYDIFEATKLALERIDGSYAIALLDIKDPQTIVCARKGSPLAIGLGDDPSEFYISSDPMAFKKHTDRCIYLEDNSVCSISDDIELYSTKYKAVSSCNITKLQHQLEDIEKGNYDSFMLKEIYEQPKVVRDCLSGRLDTYRIKLGGLEDYRKRLTNIKNITILGCGSSYYAGLLGQHYFEEFCGIKTKVEYSSEFKYKKAAISSDDVFIAISQSGETADTLGAMEVAKNHGAFIISICNSPGSSIARLADCGVHCRAGSEIGVASTKGFLSQVISLLLTSLWVEQNNKFMIDEYRNNIIDDLRRSSHIIEQTLGLSDKVKTLAKKFYKSKHCLFLGREYNFPIALEGALKLKEISYIHAEGYPAAEMKHGPIALIDKNMPVVVLSNNKLQYSKISNNIKEIQAREGKVIEINCSDESIGNFSLKVPSVIDALSPVVSCVIVQLFAYYCAKLKGYDVDKPRNLAKSVTVE